MSRQAPIRRDILLALYVPAAIVAFCQGLILPVLHLFALSFGASYAMVGMVLSKATLDALARTMSEQMYPEPVEPLLIWIALYGVVGGLLGAAIGAACGAWRIRSLGLPAPWRKRD